MNRKKWIDVREALPLPGILVLGLSSGVDTDTYALLDRTDEGDWRDGRAEARYESDNPITHWMFLPEGP